MSIESEFTKDNIFTNEDCKDDYQIAICQDGRFAVRFNTGKLFL